MKLAKALFLLKGPFTGGNFKIGTVFAGALFPAAFFQKPVTRKYSSNYLLQGTPQRPAKNSDPGCMINFRQTEIVSCWPVAPLTNLLSSTIASSHAFNTNIIKRSLSVVQVGAQVFLGGLERLVPQGDLDLLEWRAAFAGHLGVGAAQVVGGDLNLYFVNSSFR